MTEQLTKKLLEGQMPWAAVPFCYGNIYSKMSDYPKAIRYYRWGINIAIQRDIKKDIMDNGFGIANAYKKMNQPDSGIYYANKVLQASKFARHPLMQLNALTLLANVYKDKQDIDSTAKYFELALAMNDSLFNQDKVMQLQNQTFNEQERQQDLIAQQTRYRNRLRMNAILGITFTLLVTALLLWRNIRHKQKAFDLLQKQKVETDRQKNQSRTYIGGIKNYPNPTYPIRENGFTR
jgi:tetratricopeptide (TPR) repeat protein